ncbi:MAG: hypothetical protein ACRD8A_03585, partial [Candidatus Acidiferrales bacterium]
MKRSQIIKFGTSFAVLALVFMAGAAARRVPVHTASIPASVRVGSVLVHQLIEFDVSQPLRAQHSSPAGAEPAACDRTACTAPPTDLDAPPMARQSSTPEATPPPAIPPAAKAVEQTAQGKRAPVPLVTSFDGLGAGFQGPQGTARFRNPSDNSLAVGPNHIVQIVNSRLAVYTKKGQQFPDTGKVLYGPVATDSVFAGFGGPCEAHDNGDAVVRYDQLADRWLIVMPIFRPLPPNEVGESPAGQPAEHGVLAQQGQPSDPGAAVKMPPNPPEPKPIRYSFHRRPGSKPGEAVD